MWHVSSRSGVATLRTAIHLLLTCYLRFYPSRKILRFSMLSGGPDTREKCRVRGGDLDPLSHNSFFGPTRVAAPSQGESSHSCWRSQVS